MFPRNQAIYQLLSDEDPDTVRLVKQQLAAAGEENIDSLRELACAGDCRVSRHAREVMEAIHGRQAVDDFSLLCHFFREHSDIEPACWALARALEPDICTAGHEHQVNEWGRRFLLDITGATSSRERVELLSTLMADELGFGGNLNDYYNESNSLLTRVMESRCGIPLSLSILYMMVGARAGMKIDGVNLPGHFIVRHGDIYFDPFHGGQILEDADVEDILVRQGLKLKYTHLQSASARQMLVRTLSNLFYVYDVAGECEKQELVRGWISALVR